MTVRTHELRWKGEDNMLKVPAEVFQAASLPACAKNKAEGAIPSAVLCCDGMWVCIWKSSRAAAPRGASSDGTLAWADLIKVTHRTPRAYFI